MPLDRRRFIVHASGALALAGGAPARADDLSRHPTVLALRAILATPEEQIDFAKAKVAIDRLVDPRVDGEAVLAELDAMAGDIRRLAPQANSAERMHAALRAYLYEAGPWNRGRAFAYDFSDPLGTHIPNKLLANYLRMRKGNCISMPFLYIALAQKLGLTARAATAPSHVFVKLRDEAGVWHNIETVSGGNPRRDVLYHQDAAMTPEAIRHGIYMRPLSRKETVVVMAYVLLEHHKRPKHESPELVIALADVMLEYDPRSIDAMLSKGYAYFLMSKERFMSKYPTPRDIPESKREEFRQLTRNNRQWYEKAEALGWREPTKADEAKYMNMVRGVAAASAK